ncbi:hypothetical protein D3C81_1066080 [compost metagenome]
MLESTKLDVPFKMPLNPLISEPANDSLARRMTGVPLITEPSNSNWAPVLLANAFRLSACNAPGPLLVVTTLIPFSRAQRQKVVAGSPSTGLVNVASAIRSAPEKRITVSFAGSALPAGNVLNPPFTAGTAANSWASNPFLLMMEPK